METKYNLMVTVDLLIAGGFKINWYILEVGNGIVIDPKRAIKAPFEFGLSKIMVLHTLSSSYFLVNCDPFTGDTLFPNDSWSTSSSGDNEQVGLKGIREKLLSLSDQTKVSPGHGPSTTIGQDRGLY